MIGETLAEKALRIARRKKDLLEPKSRVQPQVHDSLETMGAEVHCLAISRGWWDMPEEQRVVRLLDWIKEEADEAKEAYLRRGKESWMSTDSEGLEKPEGLASELADIYLIWQDLVHGLRLPIREETRKKLDYDWLRKYRRDKYGNPAVDGD